MKSRPLSLAAQFLYAAADVLFPSWCVCCGAPVSLSDHCLCGGCAGGIPLVAEGCERCSGVIAGGACSTCSDRMFYLDRNVSVAEYEGVMERVLHHFKFNRRRRLCDPLGRLAMEGFLRKGLDCDVVTSVPMNRRKRWQRGFNQSELVARRLSRGIRRPYRTLLRERPGSGTQRDLRLRDRFINVLQRYDPVDRKALAGKRILVVDDIFTTGATVNECARVLKAAGAAEVYSLTLARAKIKNLKTRGNDIA
jgi:competence protein ComFC